MDTKQLTREKEEQGDQRTATEVPTMSYSRYLLTVSALGALLMTGCGNETTTGVETGAIRASVSLEGVALDAAGWLVQVDGVGEARIRDGEFTVFDRLSPGEYDVTIASVEPACSVRGGASRSLTVRANATTQTEFEIDCPFQGSLALSIATAGSEVDPDGYSLSIDGGAPQSVGTQDQLTFAGLVEGTHDLTLSGIDAGCHVSGDNPLTVDVVGNIQVDAEFVVVCPYHDHIAFVGGQGEDEIMVIGSDGSNPVHLTSSATGRRDNCPTWSRDGKRIAFARLQDRGLADVYVMDIAGSNVTQLTHNSGAWCPEWSPDGAKIVFDSFTGAAQGPTWGDIYVMNADGSNLINLTPSPGGGTIDPTWSPDGSRIAFSWNFDIWVMDADGTNWVRLTFEDDPQTPMFETATEPAWSPDGTRIAYVGPGTRFAVWVMDADGSNKMKLTGDGFESWSPSWSPDGSRITFWRSHSSAQNAYEIWVMNADGSNPVSISYPLPGIYSVWSRQ